MQCLRPADGTRGLPDDFLIFTRENLPLLKAKGADRPHVTIHGQVHRAWTPPPARGRASIRLLPFSLQGLAIQAETVYPILLGMPLGAFLLIIMRNVVGVKTFGTFMPILTASPSAKPSCAGARCCSRCWWGPERALGGNVARRGAAAGLGRLGVAALSYVRLVAEKLLDRPDVVARLQKRTTGSAPAASPTRCLRAREEAPRGTSL